MINPATGEHSAPYPRISDAELRSIISAGDDPYRKWGRNSTVQERAELLGRTAELHRSRRKELADIAVAEVGKPLSQALSEVDFTADMLLPGRSRTSMPATIR